MPNEEHPGFDYWPGDAADYPIGDIEFDSGDPLGAQAKAEFTVPQDLPAEKTVAERYIGIEHSTQLWFALECVKDAQGNVTCEAVLRGRHLYWFEDHNETGPGPLLEIRLSPADTWRFGSKEALAGHGRHCDTMWVFYGPAPGGFSCTISVNHHEVSAETYLRMKEAPRGVEKKIVTEPPAPEPLPPPPLPTPVPAPPPEPEPGPAT